MQFHMKHKFIIILSLIIILMLFLTIHLLKTKIYYQDGVAILIYHDINNERKGGATISTSLFKEQLSFLKDKGFTFITYQQYKKFLSGSAVSKNAVLVTFDDGYESYYTNAYPILKSLSIPSVQFVITKDLKNPQGSYIPSLSENEIRDMTKTGDLVEVQAHTDSLHSKQNKNAYLTNRLMINGLEETQLEYGQRVVSDIHTCISRLEPLQAFPVDSLAYPFGIYSPVAIDLVKQSGIQYAYTVQPGIAYRNSDRYEIPRINAGSPWITPENLLARIKNQILRFIEPFDTLPIRGILEQVGGTVEVGQKGQITLYFGHQKWSFLSDRIAENRDGQTITLSKGIIKKSGTAYITYDDLQKLFGSMIHYDKNRQHFYPDSSLSLE